MIIPPTHAESCCWQGVYELQSVVLALWHSIRTKTLCLHFAVVVGCRAMCTVSIFRVYCVWLWAAGPCARCEMICMDQATGVRAGPEPLLTLASYRRQKGKIFLGILLGRTCC